MSSVWVEDRMIENCCDPFSHDSWIMLCEKKELSPPLGNMWEVKFPPESWASGEERCVFVLCMKAVSVWGAPSWQVAFLAPGMGHTGGLSADHLLLLRGKKTSL